VQRLLRRLRADYGPEFIITLAPVYPALLPRYRIARSLVHRLLNAASYPPPDALTASVCQARHLHSKRNLSGFDHLALETSAEGRMIDWYNVQVYCGWGDPTSGAYEELVEAGWRPERLVLGVVTNRGNGAGWHDVQTIAQVARKYREKYGLGFGGIMGWEYFNAGMDRPGAVGPWEWVREVGAAMGLV
jgi:cyclin-dependent kinase